MGNACAKPVSTHAEPLKETNGDDSNEPTSMPMEGASHDSKAKTFRERRLSVAQKPATDAARRSRRLSVYGGLGGPQSDPSTPIPPVMACGAQSIAGLEPVPGGAVQKINQDRAVARYPFAGDKASFLGGVFDGHGRAGHSSEGLAETSNDGRIIGRPHRRPGSAQGINRKRSTRETAQNFGSDVLHHGDNVLYQHRRNNSDIERCLRGRRDHICRYTSVECPTGKPGTTQNVINMGKSLDVVLQRVHNS